MPNKKRAPRKEYLRSYMSNYRKEERQLLKLAKVTFGWSRKGLGIKREKAKI